MNMRKSEILIIVLSISLLLLVTFSVCNGSVKIPLKSIYCLIDGSNQNVTEKYIITRLRLPRTIGAIFAGICLSCSGLIFQAVFKNPMADSYVLGISSSSSFSICLILLLFPSITMKYSLSIFSFAGSILCTLFLFSISRGKTYKTLLTGIALNFFFSAATTLFICLSRKQLDTIMFWTMGSLASLDWYKILILACSGVCIISFSYIKCPILDLLLFDDSTALSSGVNVNTERILLLIIASISTSIVVSYCGIIGFIGLMSPHLIRIIVGPKHRKMLIPSALFGADILVLSDIISRTVIAPSELPIGIITSIIGAPVFFVLLVRKKHDI